MRSGLFTERYGSIAELDQEKAKVLNEYFKTVFTVENVGNMPAIAPFNIEAPLYDVVISKEQFLKKLLALKVSKSPGADLLHPRLLKEVAHEIAALLILIFQKSFDTGILPQDEKWTCHTHFKKGSRKAPGNYRPVSLTSMVVKLLSR